MPKQQRLRTLFITLSITGFVFGVLAFAVAQAKLLRASVDHAVSTPASAAGRGAIQNVRFTVYDEGIFPRHLRARPGVLAIVLEDHTHRRPGVVVQSESTGNRPLSVEISFPLNQARIRTEFTLGVGGYEIFDAANPANRAELSIEP